jgi:hypothetical protein
MLLVRPSAAHHCCVLILMAFSGKVAVVGGDVTANVVKPDLTAGKVSYVQLPGLLSPPLPTGPGVLTCVVYQ